jgi:hypothetical protein
MPHFHIIDDETYEQLVKGPCKELRDNLKKEIERISATTFGGDNVVRYGDGYFPYTLVHNFLIKPEAVSEMLKKLLKLIDEK